MALALRARDEETGASLRGWIVPMLSKQDRPSAMRDGTRLAGMVLCSRLARRCKRVAQLDPCFAMLSKYRVRMIFRGGAPVKPVRTTPEFGLVEGPQKKVQKRACIMPYGINMVLKSYPRSRH